MGTRFVRPGRRSPFVRELDEKRQADPLREEAHCDVMRLVAALVQPSAALRELRALKERRPELWNDRPMRAAFLRRYVDHIVVDIEAGTFVAYMGSTNRASGRSLAKSGWLHWSRKVWINLQNLHLLGYSMGSWLPGPSGRRCPPGFGQRLRATGRRREPEAEGGAVLPARVVAFEHLQ